MPQAPAQQYGMFVYDVPTANKNLYVKIWKGIRRRAIRINLSVYLIQWGAREAVQNMIDQAVEETGRTCSFRFMRFHPEEVETTENWA